MIDQRAITNASIMNLNLEIIDRVAMELSMEVNSRSARIQRLAELSASMPDARLERIIKRTRSALTELEALLGEIEKMKPVQMEDVA